MILVRDCRRASSSGCDGLTVNAVTVDAPWASVVGNPALLYAGLMRP